ncbi:cytochrome o ubiquinol oxidase subunit IV [Methylobacterium sp. BTF04]|uniref:cytochrome o ubiquinol oxidase subunit IV n=1 Tax=Methylobacterium sp. BTF04 TaxID=2708300 RepID=UPI0013D176A8|nr:cytochrome o ubiquinol oxidase subunit IV [Methylobacterium sp. BTF04]NEU13113.1 cytochrome o ubiquinol oxidase subunit IV [Methylobacterium sp. BTF04]
MSAATDSNQGAHDHHDHGDGAAHGSMKGYVTGFVLAAILTAIPFWLVMTDALGNKQTTGLVIMALAVVQIIVHMVYFLHMNTKSEGGWNFLALIFTLTLVVITLTGSIWVMYHLNTNMMPMSPMDMKHQMP